MTAAPTIESSSAKPENCTIRNTRGTGISLKPGKTYTGQQCFWCKNTNRDYFRFKPIERFEGNNVWKIVLLVEAMTANATIDPADGVSKYWPSNSS